MGSVELRLWPLLIPQDEAIDVQLNGLSVPIGTGSPQYQCLIQDRPSAGVTSLPTGSTAPKSGEVVWQTAVLELVPDKRTKCLGCRWRRDRQQVSRGHQEQAHAAGPAPDRLVPMMSHSPVTGVRRIPLPRPGNTLSTLRHDPGPLSSEMTFVGVVLLLLVVVVAVLVIRALASYQ